MSTQSEKLEDEKLEDVHSDGGLRFKSFVKPVIGPAIIAVGHIPYSKSIPSETDYLQFKKWRLGFWLLFRSGNLEPPKAICTTAFASDSPRCTCSAESLVGFLQIPEYRTVCWIRGVIMKPTDDGGANIKFLHGNIPGKTASIFSPPGSTRRRYHDGKGDDFIDKLNWSPEGVTFTYKNTFKVGRKVDFTAAIAMGNFAPSALIQIEYTLRMDGSWRLGVSGSAIPSQTSYIGCTKEKSWTMLDANNQQIYSFIHAGRCSVAPAR